MEFTIRRATEADAGIIARHRMLMFRDMGEPAQAEEALENNSRVQITEMLRRGDYHGWLAEVNGEIVAGVGMSLRTSACAASRCTRQDTASSSTRKWVTARL